MLAHDRVTVLVIPEAGGATYEYKVPRLLIIAAVVAAVAVAVLLVMGFRYFVLYQISDRQATRLEREKALLHEEVKRIDELERMLVQLQRSNQQLRTVLSESVRVEHVPRQMGSHTRYTSVIKPSERLRWGHLRTFPGLWPVNGVVLKPFTEQRGGTIIATPANSLVRAAGAGQVSRAAYDERLGNTVWVDHGGGLVSVYGFTRRLVVEAGQYVEKGQPLALSGATGKAPSASLFFAIRMNGRPMNPESYRLWL